MKKLLVTIAIALMAISAYAQRDIPAGNYVKNWQRFVCVLGPLLVLLLIVISLTRRKKKPRQRDDVTTRGTSFVQCVNKLYACGAKYVCGFFMGKTVDL